MIRLTAECTPLKKVRADVVAILVVEDGEEFKRQVSDLSRQLGASAAPIRTSHFKGKDQQTLLLYPADFASRMLLLVGAGKTGALTLEKLRRAAAVAVKTSLSLKARSLALIEPDPQILTRASLKPAGDPWRAVGMALGEGAALAVYKFDRYITPEKEANTRLERFTVASVSKARARTIGDGVRLAAIVSEATFLARDLANAPGNEIYPESLARQAQQAGRRAGFSVTVFNEAKIARLGMGGLLGVTRGSEKPPRFIVMEYNRRQASRGTIVLVGKGVTFDSGGISIKPSAGMAEMKMDMSGAAAVIGTMQAAARLKLRVHLVGLIPATENLPGGNALKPGDILKHYNGKTSEIDNTDAEGRLILADALSYAARYKPDVVIDLATLTGAVVVALGHHATGMLGNDRKTMGLLREAGDRTYERVWELPMFEEYEKLVKSDVADVKNTGGRWAGAITGAMFLKKFIGDYPWVHLDIAGTAIMEESLDYIPKGGSGVGVRLLVDFLQHWRKG